MKDEEKNRSDCEAAEDCPVFNAGTETVQPADSDLAADNGGASPGSEPGDGKMTGSHSGFDLPRNGGRDLLSRIIQDGPTAGAPEQANAASAEEMRARSRVYNEYAEKIRKEGETAESESKVRMRVLEKQADSDIALKNKWFWAIVISPLLVVGIGAVLICMGFGEMVVSVTWGFVTLGLGWGAVLCWKDEFAAKIFRKLLKMFGW